jgi:hypothetical protein
MKRRPFPAETIMVSAIIDEKKKKEKVEWWNCRKKIKVKATVNAEEFLT